MMAKKGFTLAEMVAVIAILMLLAVLSTPFVKGYIDDAYNGKAQIYMRELNEARINFERDYPGTTVSGEIGYGVEFSSTTCNIENIYGQTNLQVGVNTLIACKYLRQPTDVTTRYKFGVGSSASCDVCTPSVASMKGEVNAGNYQGKCACMDSIGQVCKLNESGTQICE